MRVSLATEPGFSTRLNEDFAIATNTLAVLLDGGAFSTVLPTAVAAPRRARTTHAGSHVSWARGSSRS